MEALSLFAIPYNVKDWLETVRANHNSHLFHDQDLTQDVQVETNLGNFYLTYQFEHNYYNYGIGDKKLLELLKTGEYEKQHQSDSIISSYNDKDKNHPIYGKNYPVKKYVFETKRNIDKTDKRFLLPPYGENLFTIIQTNKELRKDLVVFFKAYGLEAVLDVRSKTIELQKNVDGLVYKIPYYLVADTLQRIIFYLAAIKSNDNSILLFEEPENHSFPPYIQSLAEQILAATNNQFFITTHSPYLLNTFIENRKPEELAVFIVNYDDFATSVQKLTEQDLLEISDYGVDVFFNLELLKNG